MKIVYVTPLYCPVIGGVENVAQKIAEYMSTKSTRTHEVHVLTYNRLRNGDENNLPKKELINNVHVTRLKPDFSWNHGTYSSELPKVLRELCPDLVHVHVWRHPHVFQVLKLKKVLGFKAVLHGHAPFHKFNQVDLSTWAYHRLVDSFKKSSLQNFDALIALTPHEKALLIQKFGVEERKIIVIPNGIDEVYGSESDLSAETSQIVLYVGRICKSKNVELLVKAMEYVDHKAGKVKLLFAGPDEGLISKLMAYADSHGVDMEYLSIITDQQKIELYRHCALFAHPAFYEPFGITLLEAQAFGKPCVITGDGGQLYVAPDGQTSIHALSEPQNFGEAISLILNNAKLYQELSVNAKLWARKYQWSNILPAYDALYQSICA
jgi:glycosyltransferase involved in cell wall biosynthesis